MHIYGHVKYGKYSHSQYRLISDIDSQRSDIKNLKERSVTDYHFNDLYRHISTIYVIVNT